MYIMDCSIFNNHSNRYQTPHQNTAEQDNKNSDTYMHKKHTNTNMSGNRHSETNESDRLLNQLFLFV